jgi:hypothetical protein
MRQRDAAERQSWQQAEEQRIQQQLKQQYQQPASTSRRPTLRQARSGAMDRREDVRGPCMLDQQRRRKPASWCKR